MKSATGGAIASTADWEKKSAEIRKSVLAMLGTEPPMLTAATARSGSFRRRRPGGGPDDQPQALRSCTGRRSSSDRMCR